MGLADSGYVSSLIVNSCSSLPVELSSFIARSNDIAILN